MRLKIGLTQKDIAYLLDVHPAEVSKMESRHRLPSVAQIIALELIYDVHAQYLLSEIAHQARTRTLRRAKKRILALRTNHAPDASDRRHSLERITKHLHN